MLVRPVGYWDDGWRSFVRRRGRGPSRCLWLRVWMQQGLWLIFSVMWTRRVYVFFIFFNILSSTLFLYFIFNFLYIWSSEPVQTDSTRSSLEPAFFLGRHFYFRCILGKKESLYRTSPHVPHVWLCGGFTTRVVVWCDITGSFKVEDWRSTRCGSKVTVELQRSRVGWTTLNQIHHKRWVL
jgi:hypothetical protein